MMPFDNYARKYREFPNGGRQSGTESIALIWLRELFIAHHHFLSSRSAEELRPLRT
jgi:hypothetical protein